MKHLLFFLILLLTVTSQAQLNVAGINLSSNKSQLFTITTKNGSSYTSEKYNHKLKKIKFNTLDGDKVELELPQIEKIVSTGKKERHNNILKYIKYSKSKSDLMRELVTGNCSLYLRTTTKMSGVGGMGAPNTSTSNDYYVLKSGQAIAKYLKGNNLAYGRFKMNAQKFFSNCTDLVSKIKNGDYKRKDIEEIVIFYNENC